MYNSFISLASLLLVFLFASCQPYDLAKKQLKESQLPFYNTPDFSPSWISKEDAAYDQIHRIPAFQFTNQNGVAITDRSFKEKIYVADFFFTTCPGICKDMTRNMAKLQEVFATDSEVMFLSHTVTPEIDDVSALKRYAKWQGVVDGKWHLVTGDKSSIYKIARESYFADEEIGLQRNENDFLHTENFILVDKQKRIRGVYNGTLQTDMKRAIRDIKTLMGV